MFWSIYFNLDWLKFVKDLRNYMRFHLREHASHVYNPNAIIVRIWELDHKDGWSLKNWCFWTVVLEETLQSPVDCKEIQPVHPKGNQSWIFIGGTDVEVPILWSPDVKRQLIGKDPDAGEIWEQEEKGVTEDEVIRWNESLTQWT